MTDQPSIRNMRKMLAAVRLNKTIYWLSAYAVPVMIGLVTLLALSFWDDHYSSAGASPIAFKAIEQRSAGQDLAQMRETLSHQDDARLYFDTRLSELPFWLAIDVKPQVEGDDVAVEFASRHALTAECWNGQTMEPLGAASRKAASGKMSQLRAGFVLSLGHLSHPLSLICQQTFTGPARIEVVSWPQTSLDAAARTFEHYSGLLDGGLIVLGLFVLITAVINRESTYFLFAAWLVMNLRLAALSSGWDVQWLGHTIPPDWLSRVRSISLTLYYVLTFSLFCTLFREELVRFSRSPLLKVTELLCLPLILAACLLPYGHFLPVLWACTAFGTVVLVFFLTRILRVSVTPVAAWYTASLAITLLSSLYEVISASMGIKGLIGTVNFVTASLSSSLLAALAIAAQLRMRHQQWLDAQAELQHTYEVMPIGLFSLDLNGRFLSANPAMRSMIGASDAAPGKDEWRHFFDDSGWQKLHRLVLNTTNAELEIGSEDVSGEKKRFLIRATLARGRIEGSLQDITLRAKATEELQFMAHNDPLTKVLNRRGIEAVLDQALTQSTPELPLLVAYLDLDRFKLINDLYGHPAGDEVLKQVCDRINAMLTGDQRVGRVGGDEFLLVFPRTPTAVAIWVCRGIVDSIGNGSYHFGDKAFQVRGSIGLIEVSTEARLKDAISAADRACREAKHAPSNLVVYEKNAKAFQEREAELKLVEKVSGAGTPEGLFLEMQPIMSLRNPHESLNFEVLLRMRDIDGTVIPAGRVIAAAETSGRIGMIDRWVLATALEWININHATLKRTNFVCMNLSGASLNDERFISDAFDMLERNRQAAGMLCLEITESVALHDLANTRRFIDRVREYGVRIALDDFGAGYTSFSYLKELPADVLKIDGSFIVDMNAHPANVAIVEAIVNLAGNLGMKTIAEWAEDNATVQTLVEVGVDYVQGYAVSRPQSPVRILAADSAASFIEDPELAAYAETLSRLSDAPPELPPGISLVSSDGMLVTK